MPNQAHSSEFSFDLYPGLDAELNAAYARNIEQGNASAEAVATAGIAAAVGNALSQARPDTLSMAAEVQAWAKPELEAATDKWRLYSGVLAGNFDKNYIQGLANPNFGATINRLHEAQLALNASGETTPAGERVGETMHLVAVPWKAFKEAIDNLPQWVSQMRRAQSINEDDYINDDLLEAIKSDKPIYKSWDNPGVTYTAREYLDYKISQDGPWGTVLIQTSDEAGVDNWKGQSPDELTHQGTWTPELEGKPVGSMGIFEWLAVTMQEDPRQLSSKDYSWLLANRLTVDGGPQVPFGFWRGGQVGSILDWAVRQLGDTRPRLAVM